jgi:hypothetical protein
MKQVLTFLVAATAVCCAGCRPADQGAQPELSQISKKHREHRDTNGEVDGFTDTFYRGKERILIQAIYTKPTESGIRMWQEYVLDRKLVVKEMDYGDRKPPVVLLYRDNALYEAFRRHADGSVEPISSDELTKAKAELREFMAGFESAMERVRESSETNSVEKVIQDLKTEVEQQKQKKEQEKK